MKIIEIELHLFYSLFCIHVFKYSHTHCTIGLMMRNKSSGPFPQGIQLFADRTQDFSIGRIFNTAMPSVNWSHISPDGTHYQNADLEVLSSPSSSNLTIFNPTSIDSGLYRADISSILPEINNCGTNEGDLHSCSDLVLPLLTHNAVLRPVAYYVGADGKVTAVILFIFR